MQTIERQLQLNLNRIEDWADNNGFKFSHVKTVCVHFCRRRGVHPDPTLVLYKNPIPVKKETKFLGILPDSKLTFLPHIKGLKKKCVKALNLLQVVSNTDWGGDRTVLLRLYRALIRSKLDYGCFIYRAACKSYISLLDPIQNQGLRLSLGAFITSPAQSLCVEANELPLHPRREKLALQFATKTAANPNNPVYETIFNPRYVDLFRRKPRVIPTFGIRIMESLEKLDFDPDIIAKFEYPETPPWTYPTAMVNLTLSYAKKDQTDPSTYLSLHNEVKDVFRDYDFIYTDGSVSEDKAAAATVIDNYSSIESLPDKSSIFSAELHALYLALDRVETADDDERNFIIFSDSKFALQAISGQDWTHPLVLYILERLNWLVNYQEKRILFYWIPSHVGIKGNQKANAAAKAGPSGRITNVPIPYGDFRKHINSLL